jgi:LytS/YehU family sensor histidine kinase
MQLLFIFLSQLLFNILKVWEIKYTYQHKTIPLLINSVFINLASLATTFISVSNLLNGEWLVVLFYVMGSVLGKYIGMTIHDNLNNNKDT